MSQKELLNKYSEGTPWKIIRVTLVDISEEWIFKKENPKRNILRDFPRNFLMNPRLNCWRNTKRNCWKKFTRNPLERNHRRILERTPGSISKDLLEESLMLEDCVCLVLKSNLRPKSLWFGNGSERGNSRSISLDCTTYEFVRITQG